jgi:3'-5' exoribonuclease
MEQPTLAQEKLYVRDLVDGQAVDCVFVVRERTRRERRNGRPFLKLALGDVTGIVEAVVWDGVEELSDLAAPGSVVRVGGTFSVDSRYGPSLTVRSLRAAEREEYDVADLHQGPRMAYDKLVDGLRELIATVQDPHLRRLLDLCLGEESEIWTRFGEAPAAKHYHQAYRHGLLEHCLSVAQGVSAIAATFPAIDRDVAVAGALLHDVGKIDAYTLEGDAIELTDDGKLQGEIALGYYIVRREIERIPGFPPETAEALLHIVLSHHGELENGSPVVPCTREATLVHMIDNLGGRLGTFDRLEKSLAMGERWSAFDRALAGVAYFGPPREPERDAA